MDRRRAAGVLLALAASVAYATAAPTASNHTSLDLYEGSPDGCYYNFQHYGEGDRIMTNEPCLNCTCHNRMLMCYLRVCPFTKPIGQDCTIEKRADQCCPIVTCPDVPVDLLTSTTTSPAEYGATGLGKLDKYGCSIHGKYFPEGSKVPPTPNKPCEHCYCIRNMTTCVMQECTLHVDGCTPIYHKDVCCPVRYSCDHPEDEMPLLDDLSTTVRPTPGFLLTTTTLSPVTQMSQDCLYENQVISDGALIKTEKACDHCYCMKGDIVCVVQECGTPMENEGKNCTALAPREGVCCPDTYICEGDEPTTGTYESDSTTELEKLTTITPPRRAGSEGSGYRIEPDGITDTETETEGSGYEQVTIHPTFVTTLEPESHKVETPDEVSATTVKESDSSEVVTENILQKDTESQEYIPSSTSTSKIDEALSTKAQDEDFGSGEEDDVTPYETASTSSSPVKEDETPAIYEQTTDSTKEIDSEIPIPTTGAPIEDEHKSDISKEEGLSTDAAIIDLTTPRSLVEDEDVETSTTYDDEQKFAEIDAMRTTSIPVIDENESKATDTPKQDKETSEPHYVTSSTSAPGIEEEIATTETQDMETDGFDGTVPEFDVQHQVTMTASTPLLEEIEKDTNDQDMNRVESTPSEGKISTIASSIPTEEPISKDSLMPDPLDETISTNIPTTVATFEDDVQTTSVYDDSSEPQQYSPMTTEASSLEYATEKTISIDSQTTSKPHGSQETDINENLEPQYASTVSAPVFDDKTMEITSLHEMTTSKFDDTDVEQSTDTQKYLPTTSSPMLDVDTKDKEISQTDVTTLKESSEPQEYGPTTTGALFDDETKISTPSDIMTSSEDQEASIEDTKEPHHYATTTRKNLIDDETRATTFVSQEDHTTSIDDHSESLPTTSAPTSEDEIKISTASVLDTDTTESSENLPKTNAPVFEDEIKKTSPSDSSTTPHAQESHELDDNTSESHLYASTTSVPAIEDEAKKTTQSEVFTASEALDDHKTEIEVSSEPNAPSTIGQDFEDESKITTLSDSMTTIKVDDIQESDIHVTSDSQNYSPTTSAPTLDDESKVTSPSDYKESTTLASEFEDKPKETSATIYEQNEITTIEPDKGLNTIPSGSVDEETTGSPDIAKYTHSDEVIPTELATEQDSKLYDVTELDQIVTEHAKPDTSASSDDLLTQSTEPTVKEHIDQLSSTETHVIAEQTTVVPTDIIEEALPTSTYDHQPSTVLPVSEYQESITTTLSVGTEETSSEKQSTTVSSYEHLPETTSTQSEIPVSTIADIEENEISNESRIPGEGDCLLNGVTYRNESAVPSSNKCQSGCRCSSSIIKCDPIICSPPPEYMDNCQTTYDSPDSCCPTYVCDHKTETMPPQSHSQMSGTEASVESPIKCVGDECILSEDKKDDVSTSELCDSGSCTGQVDSHAHPTNVPEPAEDTKDGCTQENGCQTSPVKPCEGTDCDVPSDATRPEQQKPCNGENCDIPVRECNNGKCSDENELNVENECTEESCRRKEGIESEQQPPKKCSGSECQLTETTSEMELTTLGTIDTKTEKIEQSSKSPTTEAGYSSTDKSEEHVTDDITISESETSTAHPSESTKLSDQGSEDDRITSSFEPITPSENEESSVTELGTKAYDENEQPTISPDTDITDKFEYEATTKVGELHTDTSDLSHGDKSTDDVSHEETTGTSTMSSVKDSQDVTTLSSQEEYVTQQPEKPQPDDISTHISEDNTNTEATLIDEANSNASTELPRAPDSAHHEATSDMNEDGTVKYDSEDFTKLPQVTEEVTTKASKDIDTTNTYESPSQDTTASEDSTSQDNIIDTETTKAQATDVQASTEIPKDSQNDETSAKTTDNFDTQPEISATTIPSQTPEIKTEFSPDITDQTHDIQSPVTTQTEISAVTMAEEEKTDSPSEENIPDATESSEDTYSKETTLDTTEEIVTQTLKPYSTQPQETTATSEKTENAEVTKISSVTEPSIVSETEEPIVTESPAADEFTSSHSTADIIETETVKDQETVTELTKPQEEAVTESFKPGEPEVVSTTTSSQGDFDVLGTTTKTAIETDIESTKSDETESISVTSTESVSDVTTIKSSEEDQKLFSESDMQEKTTLQPETVSELSDSKTMATERTDYVNEVTTEIQEATKSITESATESVEKETSISSDSITDKEDDLTSITHHEITTEASLDLVTIPGPHSEATESSDEPEKLDATTPTVIDTSTLSQSITDQPIEQESETPTEAPEIHVSDAVEIEKDTTFGQTTSKPRDTTEFTDNAAEPITTESEMLTKQPVDSESQTIKPVVYDDEQKSEAPLSNELTTAIFEEKTESPKDIVEEPVTTHIQEIDTKTTEPQLDTFTETALDVSKDGEVTNEPSQIKDDEVTTAAIQISEETSQETSHVFTNAPTESSAPQDEETKTTPKGPLDIDTLQPIETTPGIEDSQDIEIQTQNPQDTAIAQEADTTPVVEISEDKETQTMAPDLTSNEESTIKEQLPTSMVKLTTESPKETQTETLDESVTTEKPVYTETVTELMEATKDEEEKSPEEELKPASFATTVSEEVTKAYDQDDKEISTEKSTTIESVIFETTKTVASIETSTLLSDTVTSQGPGDAVDTSTPKYDDEAVHVDKETTSVPTTVPDLQTIGIDTEYTEPALIDTSTKKQEEDIMIPIETESPEKSPTSVPVTEEPAELTPSPIEEVSTDPDQVSSEPHTTEEEKLTTSVALEEEKISTPKPSEIEMQTEKTIIPTESSFQPEISPTTPEEVKETTAREEEKLATTPESEKLTTAREEERQTTAKAEEITTAYPVFDKFTTTTQKPTDAPATEQPKPITTEQPLTDDIVPPDDESSGPPSGTSGYETDPDYMEEDQTFGPGTCRYGGKVYVSAQQIPRDDPCDFCFCFRSDIICLQQSCPPPIHGCHEEPISGFCCPRYECPVSMATTVNVTTTTTTTTTTLPPHFPVHSYKGSAQKRGCLIKGHTYKVGEVVRASSGPCLHCTCGGDGQMKCDPKQCTPEPMLRQMIAAAVSAKRRR